MRFPMEVDHLFDGLNSEFGPNALAKSGEYIGYP